MQISQWELTFCKCSTIIVIRYQDRCPTALSRNAQAVILLVCGFVQKKEQNNCPKILPGVLWQL